MHRMRKLPKKSDPPTEMTIEGTLIAAIKKHTCLYNKDTINYRKRAVKQKAWQEVAAEVGWSVKECQHRWRSLRDRYVREIRENTNCKWKYMSHLTFLNPHLRNNYVNNTDEESCSPFESLSTTIDHEEENMMQEGIDTSIPNIEAKVEIDVDETELEMEDTDEECDEIPEPSPMAFVAFPCSSNSTPKATTTPKFDNDTKRKRVDSVSVESNGRFSMVSEVNSAEIENKTKSRNEDYYKTLDSYMLQLPPSVQDDLKIELLNRVYCEVKSKNLSEK